MLTVAIILICIAFFTSLAINLKYMSHLKHALLIYSIILISFSGGAVLLLGSQYFKPTTSEETISRVTTTQRTANLESSTPALSQNNQFKKPNAVTDTGRPAKVYQQTAELQMLTLFSGRTSTVNVPRGMAFEIVDLSCDVIVTFQQQKQRILSGETAIYSAPETQLERIKLDVIDDHVPDRQLPRGSQATSNKPFSSQRPRQTASRPKCSAQFRLI